MSRYRLINLSKGDQSEAWLNEAAAEGYRIAHIVQPSTATAPTMHYHPMAIMERRAVGPLGRLLVLGLIIAAGVAFGWMKAKGY